MNILITGNISSLALKFASEAGENSKVIIASGKLPKRRLGVNVHTYAASPRDKLFGRVIESNSFDAMVYFLARGEETDVSGGEVSVIGTSIEFAAALEHCRVRNIPRIVLVSSGEVYSGRPNEAALESAAPIPGGVGGCLIKTAEDMCKYYQIAILRSITVVHLPYVYFREPNDFDESKDSLITNIIYDAVSKKSVTLPGYPFTKCDFLSADDAAKLILLTADKRAFSDDVEVVNAGTGSPITFENLERMIKTDYPDVSVNYSNDDTDVPVPMPSESAKTEYDWTALERIDDDFPDMSFYYFKAPHNKGIIAAVKALRSRRTFFAVEFATATVLMQAVVMQFGTSMVSGLIDFRLLYIVILSTLHGIAAGIVSALLAIVSLMFSSLRGDWRTILYNPENWMPFAIYLIVGTVLGYTADKKRDDLANANEQLQIMELTNEHISSLFDEAVQNKESYKNQILGYRDSFGKIFSVVRNLDTEVQENVMSEAISVLEDLLDTQSIAVYSIDANGVYARLTVRSRALTDVAEKSIKLSEYAAVTSEISPGRVWFNRDLLPGYPMYCAPIYSENRIIALVMINKVRTDQMSLYYSNMVMILCGLIQDALARAIKSNRENEEKMYLHGTRIMKTDAFAEVYKANLNLAEQEKIQLRTIVVEAHGQDLSEVSSKLENCVRETDSIGMLSNGVYGICLTQITNDDLQKVLRRLSNGGMVGVQSDALSGLNAGVEV